MTFMLKGKFLSVRSRVAKNGKTYHNMIVLQGDETISLGCSEDIAAAMEGSPNMAEYNFEFREYVNNSQQTGGAWVSRYCTSVHPVVE